MEAIGEQREEPIERAESNKKRRRLKFNSKSIVIKDKKVKLSDFGLRHKKGSA